MPSRSSSTPMLVLAAAALTLAGCGSSTTTSSGTASQTTPEPTATTAATTTPGRTTPDTRIVSETTTAPTTTATPTTVAPTTAAPAPSLTVCPGSDAPGGEDATASLLLDLRADGSADDLVEGFFTADGLPRLRVTTGEGVYSEVTGVVDGNYRPLGTAPIFPGGKAELIAVIGEGSAATEVGVFTLDAGDCLTPYAFEGSASGQFTGLIRPDSPVRSGMFCFEGGIALYGAELFDDGTWAAYGAAYEQRSEVELQFIGASDDYAEGLDESELGVFELDCFGLTI